MHCELCIYIRIIDYRIYMKTFKKSLLLLAVSLFLSSVAFAQTKSLAQKADDLFNQKQYIAALEKYEEAYNKISSNKAEKNRCYFQMGECYRLMNNFPKAERVYKRLINQKYYNTEPKLYYYMAEMYRFENKFDECVCSGEFSLNLLKRTFKKNEKVINLTKTEFQIIEYFMSNSNLVLSRNDILNHVWGQGGDEKMVDVNVRRLRMKIEDEPAHPKHIITIWGAGYKWEA